MAAAKFTIPAAQKIVDATKKVLAAGSDITGTARPRNQAYSRTFWAKLTSATAFEEVYDTIVGGVVTWTTLPSGRTGTLLTPCTTSGNVVLIRLDFDCVTTPGTVTPIYQVLSPPGPFVVKLTQTGGGDGSQTTGPTYTYTVNYVGTLTPNIATAVGPPEVGRSNGSFLAATLGLGYFDNTGTFHLLRAYEQENTGTCP